MNSSRSLIMAAYVKATEKGLNQCRWSSNAGLTQNGQTVLRILQRGDCRLSTFVSLLDAAGCEIAIKEKSV